MSCVVWSAGTGLVLTAPAGSFLRGGGTLCSLHTKTMVLCVCSHSFTGIKWEPLLSWDLTLVYFVLMMLAFGFSSICRLFQWSLVSTSRVCA